MNVDRKCVKLGSPGMLCEYTWSCTDGQVPQSPSSGHWDGDNPWIQAKAATPAVAAAARPDITTISSTHYS